MQGHMYAMAMGNGLPCEYYLSQELSSHGD